MWLTLSSWKPITKALFLLLLFLLVHWAKTFYCYSSKIARVFLFSSTVYKGALTLRLLPKQPAGCGLLRLAGCQVACGSMQHTAQSFTLEQPYHKFSWWMVKWIQFLLKCLYVQLLLHSAYLILSKKEG